MNRVKYLQSLWPLVSAVFFVGCFFVCNHALRAEGDSSKASRKNQVVEDIPHVIRNDYYVVEGSDTSEILRSMEERRPHDHYAYTDWFIEWNYSFLIEPDNCQLRSFDVRVQIRYTLPEWKQPATASAAMVKEWQRYMDALIMHEKGHAQLGFDAARKMREFVVFRKWSAANRQSLRQEIDRECQKILKEYKLKEVKFDKETDHGRTQGARLLTPAR